MVFVKHLINLRFFLLLATCPKVNVLHTKHSSGDNGRYFFFSKEEFSKLVGDDNWNGQEFEIVQYGSHSWRGKVKVWSVASGSHGRKVDGVANGDWKKDDTIMLQTCSKEGKILNHKNIFEIASKNHINS